MTDSNGLYYMRARYYNPELRRFINQDVVLGSIDKGQSLNRYAYVNGNPVTFVDPFGLSRRYYYHVTLTYQEKVLAKAKSPNASTWDRVNGLLWSPMPSLTVTIQGSGRYSNWGGTGSGSSGYIYDNQGHQGLFVSPATGVANPTRSNSFGIGFYQGTANNSEGIGKTNWSYHSLVFSGHGRKWSTQRY